MNVRSLLVVVLALHVGCTAPSARSDKQRTTLPSPVVRPAAPPAGVVIRPEAIGLRVSYRAISPETAFSFGGSAAEIRKDTWHVIGHGLSLTEDGIVATVPVASFDLTIEPDAKQRDRQYPGLSRVGEGWLIYAPSADTADRSTATPR